MAGGGHQEHHQSTSTFQGVPTSSWVSVEYDVVLLGGEVPLALNVQVHLRGIFGMGGHSRKGRGLTS